MRDWVEMRSADMYCRWAAGAALCLFTFSYHCIVGKKNLISVHGCNVRGLHKAGEDL